MPTINDGRTSNRSTRSIVTSSGGSSGPLRRFRNVLSSLVQSTSTASSGPLRRFRNGPGAPVRVPLPASGSGASNIKIIEHDSGRSVTFKLRPEISEDKNVSYVELNDIRQPATLMIYMGSRSRQFTLSVQLVSRTEEEAASNFKTLHLMKSWAMPLGKTQSSGASLGSDAPSILHLYGYGQMFKGIQVVLKTINIKYPTDVDYISTGAGLTTMPIMMDVMLTLAEIRSAEELQAFDIAKYRRGELETW